MQKFILLSALFTGTIFAAAHPPEWIVSHQLHSPRNVIFSCDFETDDWYREWGMEETSDHLVTLIEDPDRRFVPLDGKALRVQVKRGDHYGANFMFRFKEQTRNEPEEVYFQYYLRFADDWNPDGGGKLPGISGTYGRAGWGGRRVNGKDGWSARGSFRRWQEGFTPIGFYCYHVDMEGRYGSVWTWEKDRLGYLRNNLWYCIEQYLRLNTPGRNDGMLRGWIDGQLAFENSGVRFRDTSALKIEMIWMNVYHGGTRPAATDDHLYIDNVIIASSYIGPID